MTERSERRPRTKVHYGRLIAAVGIVAIILIFVIQNTASTAFTFLFWGFDTPLWSMLVMVLAIGVAVGWALTASRGRRR